jgi:diguanylate cyclase (GGDEF)-like protein
MDVLAEAAYADMQLRCTDPGTAELCGALADDEASHVQWWTELLQAWDDGLLADVWTTSATTLGQLADTLEELERLSDTGTGALDTETVLTTAARIEFFALDPIFAELLDLAEPGVARSRHEAYATHTARVIAALDAAFAPESLMGFLSRILKRAELENRALSQYATMDPLTGLGNRRSLATQAAQWASWAARYGSAVTFLMVDVDHFKTINDLWGHAVGDRALVALADALRGALRSADLVARYGGDEFVVLAPELEPGDAEVVAERLVRAAREIRIDTGNGAYVALTISVGIVSAFDPPNSEPRSMDALLAAADRSLYAAKKAGRDRWSEPVVLLREA